MNLLLRAFLIRRSRDSGFAIPMVIALGLIMLLLGIASIYKSSDQKDIATTQKKTSEALSVAEAGVSHYVEFLQRNSVLATYDYSAANWDNSALDTCDKSTNLPVAIANFGNFANQTVNGDSDKQYRLVSYTYEDGNGNRAVDATTGNPLPPTNNTIGVLQVEGQSRLGNGFATSKLKVEIPVRPENKGVNNNGSVSPLASYAQNPTLWIGEYGSDTDIGNLKIKSYGAAGTQFPYGGNIVLSRTKSLGTDACTLPKKLADANSPTLLTNLDSSSTQRIIADPRNMPPSLVPSKVAPNTYKIITNIADLQTLLSQPTPDAKVVTTDSNTGEKDTYYYYSFGNPTLTPPVPIDLVLDNNSFSTVAGTKVILFLTGNLTLRNGAGINPGGNISSPFLEIYGGPNTTSIIFEENRTTPGVDKNIKVNAFIHAPNATVEVKGTPRIKITGAMWVKNWKGGSGELTADPVDNLTSSITPDTTRDRSGVPHQSTLFYSTSPFVTPKPTIFPPTKWETVEAN
jgi:hypothetical protein